ncbi:Flp pilus assembly protein CpaB [Desulfofalx alkaliphila]|uniref:Flp pilus assembly protein CpaB n=1 Tax=Desulfofalx alkaliphila TaxID=105483 RepID=UPI0004E12A23|nr:SAF domain-containing protein [Desulfofalx alkaliphila]
MRKIKKILHILIALVLAAGAGFSVWYFLNINNPTVKVVVTRDKLPIGTVVSPNDVTTKLVAKSVMPPNAISDVNDVVGKTVVATVFRDEVLRKEHVATNKGSLQAILETIAPNRVAVDLPPDAARGLKGLSVGDKVNIYGEVAFIASDGNAATQISKVATNAIVLYSPDRSKNNNEAIIIACTPEEEKQIANVLTMGKNVTVFLQQSSDEKGE